MMADEDTTHRVLVLGARVSSTGRGPFEESIMAQPMESNLGVYYKDSMKVGLLYP
jgi:hypothetical protein